MFTGYSLSDRRVFRGVASYLVAGVCWVPVVWMQIRMRNMAAEAVQQKTALPDAYWVFGKGWIIAGSVAFPAVVAVFYLMIAKP